MLAIRLQRTGRHGHAQYRVVVQDSHQSPKSGKVVARLGSYNPHTKVNTIDKEKAQFYLDHGAQPSDRIVSLLTAEGVKMPKWVTVSEPKERTVRNPEKLRKNQPAEAAAPEAEAAPAAENAETPSEENKEAAPEVAANESEAPEEVTPEAAPESTEEAPADETEDQKA